MINRSPIISSSKYMSVDPTIQTMKASSWFNSIRSPNEDQSLNLMAKKYLEKKHYKMIERTPT